MSAADASWLQRLSDRVDPQFVSLETNIIRRAHRLTAQTQPPTVGASLMTERDMRRNIPIILLTGALLGGAISLACRAEAKDELATKQRLPEQHLPTTTVDDQTKFSTEIPLPPPFDPSYTPPQSTPKDAHS
ncbi:MAG: hypothetical protein HYX63_14210 [Gammaproteobacteria bacterium]|nr:hypothetical protein [Gammaproteobacteria bacterium]